MYQPRFADLEFLLTTPDKYIKNTRFTILHMEMEVLLVRVYESTCANRPTI